jgi:hypothetical protein
MTEAFTRPGPSLLPIERPRCRECHGRMMLARIQPGSNGSEIRTFECPKCELVQKKVGRGPVEVSEHGLDGRRASAAEVASVRFFVPERIPGHRLESRFWRCVPL